MYSKFSLSENQANFSLTTTTNKKPQLIPKAGFIQLLFVVYLERYTAKKENTKKKINTLPPTWGSITTNR
jgi:hypothetical protein